MSYNLSRRRFIKTSAISASAVALGTRSVARGFPANEKVQIGWIGIGGRCTRLMIEMNKVTDARTVAVCDLKPDRIEKGKELMAKDKPKGYTDFRKMMDSEKLDGILVVTEPNNHSPLVVPVLEAGYHCFAEKPMDTTVQRVDAIVNAARNAKGFYQIGTQRRYSPTFLAGMPVILNGKIGKVTFMQGQWHWWRGSTKRLGERDGWGLTEQACHHMDVMSWAMKEKHPVSCVSIGYNQDHMPPKTYRETHSATAFKFPDGTIFSYTHLFLLAPHFEKEKLWVFGEKAGVDLPAGMMYGRDKSEKKIAEPAIGNWGTGQTEQLFDFVDNIKTGGKRIPNANVETGRIGTLMSIMGRTAMIDFDKNAFEPRVIKWKDLGSTTDK
ncbi:MAG: Gfo/Idh/MocA family oxidoreductase [Planctomycetota bacterium]|nr:MAG: Gfo/Idh/MocA family oxidoreductase [Planctomycetota bacterium]